MEKRKGIIRFLKDWTLPTAIALGTVCYLTFRWVPALDEAGDWLGPVFDTLFPVSVFLTLFVTACKVDFHDMRPHRWHLGVLVAQLLLVAGNVGIILWVQSDLEQKLLWEAVLTCIIGPSGCGKSTLLRTLNRLIDTTEGVKLDGQVLVDEQDILADEATSALDPISAKTVEDLFVSLKEQYSIIMVTHTLRQALRIADHVVFMYLGEIIEQGPADQVFHHPQHELTQKYLNGAFS